MPRDQKVLAHDPERPHEFLEDTTVYGYGDFSCAFCGKRGDGVHLTRWNYGPRSSSHVQICRACIRLALYKMAEIPEAQQ